MTAPARCEPPEHLRDRDGWHWLEHNYREHRECVWWDGRTRGWFEKKTDQTNSPELMGGWGWCYLCPAPTPAEIAAQAERDARLVAALRETAKQKLLSELDEEARTHADTDGAYDECVKTARAALAAYEEATR